MFNYIYYSKNGHIASNYLNKNHDIKWTSNASSHLFNKNHDSNINLTSRSYLYSTNVRGP